MNVFVSWRGSDREIKNTLVTALRNSLGQDNCVWESDDDCLSNFSSDCINAIRQSQVFIVIVSDEAMKPSYVINEVIEARSLEMRGLLNIVVYKITDSDYTPEFAANLNHISDANHVARINSNVSGTDSLIRRVSYLLQKRRSNNPEKPYDVFKPELDGIPLGKSGYFVEHSRDDVIKAISAAFKESNIIFTTQLGGYGRRSAVRNYAEQYSDEYDKIYVLHLFSGSMRDFFLKGVNITNINSNAFERLTENEEIQKKSSLLGKLDRRTLLIVPNLRLGYDDDSFVRDALCAVGCRIIFITETLPTHAFEYFSVISITRLKNEYLNDLFFHYYDKADDEEREELIPYLESFYNKIEGHTKSVEITAKTLSGEYGVYPDDIPEILDSIKLDSENKLSKRIFLLISEMFEIQQFNDTDKTVLLVATMTAQLPLDERLFISALDRYDDTTCWSESIRRLIEHRWLTYDSANRLICLEPFMASVCLAKIQPDIHLSTNCLNFLTEKYISSVYLLNSKTSTDCIKRLSVFFSCIGNKEISNTVMMFSKFLDDGEQMPTFDKIKIHEVTEKAQYDASLIGDAAWCEAISEFCSIFSPLMRSLDMINSMKSTTSDITSIITTDVNFLKASFGEILHILPDDAYLSKNDDFSKLIDAIKTLDFQSTLKLFCPAVNELVGVLDESDYFSDEIINEVIFLQYIGNFILMFFTKNTYQLLDYARACFELFKLLGWFCDDATEYRLLTKYFKCLYEYSGSMDEADFAFSLLLKRFDSVKRSMFTYIVDADTEILKYISQYSEMLISSDRTDEAERLFKKRVLNMEPVSADSTELVLEICNSIVNSYMAAGDIEKCTDFLKMALAAKICNTMNSQRGKEEYSSAVNTYELLSDTYKMLTTTPENNELSESSDEYIDYYRTFPSSSTDRRLLGKYSKIATAATEFDFSKLTDAQLCEETAALRKQSSFLTGISSALEARAFALVSEAGYRVLGYKHHYVQYLGAAALVDGKIAEIHNGEGKTYTIILAAYFHAVCGRQTHILDTSKFLTERNYAWMRGVLELLGLKVGLLNEIVPTSRLAERFAVCDVIYSTISTEILTSLFDESSTVPFGIRYDAIIADECDYLLFDSGAIPCIIASSDNESDNLPSPERIYDFVSGLPTSDKELFEITDKRVIVKLGLTELAEKKGFDIRGEQSEKIHNMIKMCLIALYVYQNNCDYYIIKGKVNFENTSTGCLYEPVYNYTYFISRKEGITPPDKPATKRTHNLRSVADFIRGFTYISGATATASSVSKELEYIYGLNVISIPPNIPEIRIDNKPAIFIRDIGKLDYIMNLVRKHHKTGQPVLLITGSINESVRFGEALTEAGIGHRLVNAQTSEDSITELMSAGELGAVTVTTAMANRGVDILPGGNPSEMAFQHLISSGYSREQLTNAVYSPNNNSSEMYALSQKHKALLSFYKNKIEEKRKTVLSLGGICVIGTECFDDLRTEQQLRGRTGRQGAPGISYIVYSFDDERLKSLLNNKYYILYNSFRLVGDTEIPSDYLYHTITKMRSNLYFYTAKNKFIIPDLMYYSAARKIVIGTLRNIRSGKYDICDFTEEYFSSLPENINALRALVNGKDTENLSVNMIYPLIADKITKMSDKALSALLTEGVHLYLSNALCLRNRLGENNTTESLRSLFVTLLSNTWMEYLNRMEIILNQYDLTTVFNSKKLHKSLLDRSEAQYTSLLREIVPELLRLY